MSILRIPNLLVVALTQALLYYGIFVTTYVQQEMESALRPLEFALLVLATCLVTAAGYVVNDLEDIQADEINRPEQLSVGRFWTKESAQYLFLCLVMLAYLCSLLLALQRFEIHLLWIFPLSVAGLSWYSLRLKKIPFWGNLVVAAYCAAVAGLIVLAERAQLQELFDRSPVSATRVLLISGIYMLFAFWATLLREIIKDLEDREGDHQAGYQTLALVWPEYKVRRLAYGCTAALAGLLGLSLCLDVSLITSAYFRYFIIFLLLVLLLWSYYLYKARSSTDYHRLSQWLKWYMVSGVLLILLF